MGLNLSGAPVSLLAFIDNRHVENSQTVIIDLALRYVMYWLRCDVLCCAVAAHPLSTDEAQAAQPSEDMGEQD